MKTIAAGLMLVLLAGWATDAHGWYWDHHVDTDCDTVVEVAVANNFTILVQALQAANLTDTFNDTSLMVTVFAPTDEAFLAAIAALNTTAEDLLANTELLTTVLQTHVVDALLGLESWEVKTLNPSQNLVIAPTVAASNIANVSTPGVRACRSFVYPIDTVLLPSM